MPQFPPAGEPCSIRLYFRFGIKIPAVRSFHTAFTGQIPLLEIISSGQSWSPPCQSCWLRSLRPLLSCNAKHAGFCFFDPKHSFCFSLSTWCYLINILSVSLSAWCCLYDQPLIFVPGYGCISLERVTGRTSRGHRCRTLIKEGGGDVVEGHSAGTKATYF